MARPTREPALAAALGVVTALALTRLAWPDAPWLPALGLLGGVWAPGYALVRLAYPPGRLSLVERHALAAAAGLLLLPLVVVGLSLGHAFTPFSAALALALLAWGAAFAARLRPAEADEPPVRARLPGTRVTLAIAGGALAVAALVLAPTLLRAPDAPASLALTGPDGGPPQVETPVGGNATFVLTARAGDAPARGLLVVSWRGEPVREIPLDLPAGGERVVALELPVVSRAEHRLEARWEGVDREVSASVRGVRA